MADASRTVDIIFRGQNQLGAGIDSVEQSLGGIGEEASEAEGKVDDLGGQVEALGDKPRASIISLGSAMTALGVIAGSAVLKGFIDSNVAVDKFGKSIEYATGVAGSGATEWEYISGVADKLGISVLSAADAYSKFVGATTGTALKADDAKKIFEAVAGSISAVGGSSADVEGALVQLSQGIAKNRFELEDLKSIADRVPGGMYTLAESIGLTTAELYKQVTAGQIGTEEIIKYAAALQEKLGGASFDTFVNETERLKNAVVDLNIELAKSGGYDLLTSGVELATDAVGKTGDSVDTLQQRLGLFIAFLKRDPLYEAIVPQGAQDAVDRYVDKLLGIPPVVEGVSNAVSGTLEPIQAQGAAIIYNLDAWENYGQALDEAGDKAGKTKVELEQIASNERIKNMEFKVALDIAEVEANAKKVESAFESINVGIESTGDLLKGLFDNLGEADSFREMFQIEDQIKLENERRTKELELQEKLTKATIDELKARQQMMKSGGALVTVNGDGLQPHLEAFMWEILEAIQVRVNADGYEMLLGGP